MTGQPHDGSHNPENRADQELEPLRPATVPPLALLAILFDSTGGEAIERNVPEAWDARTSDELNASYFTRRIHGETAGRVRVEGSLERWVDEGDEETGRSVQWVAPVELVMTQRPGGNFAIASARVGAFERVEGICPPGTPTGAEQANNCRW